MISGFPSSQKISRREYRVVFRCTGFARFDGLGPRASFRASMTVTSAPLRRPSDDRCVRNIILPGSGRNDSLVRVI
jgi:hypothetical protein